MNNILTDNQIDLINKNGEVIFATSNINNQPRAIIVIPSRVEASRMILSNVQMQSTINNLKNNNKCFINAFIKDIEMEIKIEGIATIYEDGELFNEIKTYEETNNLPADLKVNSIIVVDYQNISISQE